MEIDSEDEDHSEVEYDIVDPWEDLRAKVKESFSSRFGKQVERLLEKGASEPVAEAKAFNALLPVFRGKSYGGCTCTISSGSVVSNVIPYTKKS